MKHGRGICEQCLWRALEGLLWYKLLQGLPVLNAACLLGSKAQLELKVSYEQVNLAGAGIQRDT